ncbi:hypothetical protein KFE96_12450 [Kordiimonas sp. SCSIO 12603]|uniref:hypothetical protein n=1 Tax=Kordiimonas sp. SCSIO 12603 TaxID=2829596 RepID=UPI002106BFC6|nr:hypothetical protein [Kordiimonas sp. SCSIO 12603]UTW57647.1 hypothetical protein KFE96_12450 [Kordiimonas sp. SCSIO 12603]
MTRMIIAIPVAKIWDFAIFAGTKGGKWRLFLRKNRVQRNCVIFSVALMSQEVSSLCLIGMVNESMNKRFDLALKMVGVKNGVGILLKRIGLFASSRKQDEKR